VKVEKKKFRKFKLGKSVHFGFPSLHFLNFFYYIIYNRIYIYISKVLQNDTPLES